MAPTLPTPGGRWVVVVDGVEAGAYDGFVRGSPLAFDGPTSFHPLAILGDAVVRLLFQIAAASGDPPKRA